MSYLEIVNALATIVIAVFAIVAVRVQWKQNSNAQKIANANYILALHDKRLEYLEKVETYLFQFMREGKPSLEDAVKLRNEIKNARYIFPEQAMHYVKELVDKSAEYHSAYLVWEPLRERSWHGENLSEEEESHKISSLEKMHTITKWFVQQIENEHLRTELDKYLRLPASLSV